MRLRAVEAKAQTLDVGRRVRLPPARRGWSARPISSRTTDVRTSYSTPLIGIPVSGRWSRRRRWACQLPANSKSKSCWPSRFAPGAGTRVAMRRRPSVRGPVVGRVSRKPRPRRRVMLPIHEAAPSAALLRQESDIHRALAFEFHGRQFPAGLPPSRAGTGVVWYSGRSNLSGDLCDTTFLIGLRRRCFAKCI